VSENDLSVVVFGATGVTGRGVAAHLADRAAETGATWAAAGRDPEKVARVLDEIGVEAPETIRADIDDPSSLAEMASRATVVLDLVGPYTLYGRPVIEACVAGGAHYVDLTGEIPFLQDIVTSFHGRAQKAGVKLMQVSGFEALPPDLAVLLAADTARERFSEELAEADLLVATRQPAGRIGMGDVISGGTLQSLAEALDSPNASVVADPAALIEDPGFAEEVRRTSPIALAPRFTPDGGVVGPMAPAAFINPAVIHRTTALTAAERGEAPVPLRYREGMVLPGGGATLPLRYAAAGALAGTQAGAMHLVRAGQGVRTRTAKLLRRALPSSGFGPSGPKMEDWSWRLEVEGRTVGGRHVRVELDADGHPGYLTTAKMVGEAGLMLAEEGVTPERAGCLTPAAALGTESIDRFERAGMRFAVTS
jgi:short subunit dehydrogenase-like uncharacterized protein